MNPTVRVAAALCIALTACTPSPPPNRLAQTESTDTPVEVRHVVPPQGWKVAGEHPVSRIVQRDGQTVSELTPIHLVRARGTKLAAMP